jgi:hypothetical protein
MRTCFAGRQDAGSASAVGVVASTPLVSGFAELLVVGLVAASHVERWSDATRLVPKRPSGGAAVEAPTWTFSTTLTCADAPCGRRR